MDVDVDGDGDGDLDLVANGSGNGSDRENDGARRYLETGSLGDRNLSLVWLLEGRLLLFAMAGVAFLENGGGDGKPSSFSSSSSSASSSSSSSPCSVCALGLCQRQANDGLHEPLRPALVGSLPGRELDDEAGVDGQEKTGDGGEEDGLQSTQHGVNIHGS